MLSIIETFAKANVDHVVVTCVITYLIMAVSSSILFWRSKTAMMYQYIFAYSSIVIIFNRYSPDDLFWSLTISTVLESINARIMIKHFRWSSVGLMIGVISAVNILVNMGVYYSLAECDGNGIEIPSQILQCKEGSNLLSSYYTINLILNIMVLSFLWGKFAHWCKRVSFGFFDLLVSPLSVYDSIMVFYRGLHRKQEKR